MNGQLHHNAADNNVQLVSENGRPCIDNKCLGHVLDWLVDMAVLLRELPPHENNLERPNCTLYFFECASETNMGVRLRRTTADVQVSWLRTLTRTVVLLETMPPTLEVSAAEEVD